MIHLRSVKIKMFRYDTIVAWMEQLAADNPSFITLENLGSSHEGRKILLLKVGTSPRGAQTRAVWVDGGIHAREWIAVATATFLLDKIVEVFRTEDKSNCDVEAVQSVDWYIAPLLNPGTDNIELHSLLATDSQWKSFICFVQTVTSTVTPTTECGGRTDLRHPQALPATAWISTGTGM